MIISFDSALSSEESELFLVVMLFPLTFLPDYTSKSGSFLNQDLIDSKVAASSVRPFLIC